MDSEERFAARALGRIERATLFLAGAGAIAAGAWGGWRWAAGFLLGAAASWLNFAWIRKVANSLGNAAAKPPRARVAIVLGLRYALLAAGAYVIVNLTQISLAAALSGLFVPVAAVVLEILFELAVHNSQT